jgi:uncharacterized protein YceK
MKKIAVLLLLCSAIALSGCSTMLMMFIPKSATSSSTTSTTVLTGSFSLNGTVSAGGLTTTEAVGLVVFNTKNGIQDKTTPPITQETHALSAGTFSFSIPTTEARDYYIIAYHPIGDSPVWLGSSGVTANCGFTQFINQMQPITPTAANPNPTVNITLYQVTGL